MMRKFSALLAAFAFAAVTIAPVAEARDGRRWRGDYDRHYRHHDRDRGDAVAAGAVGLILGLAIGSLASQPREPQARCYDNYRRCSAPPPPPRDCYDRCGYERDSYYEPRYQDEGYGSAYEDEYGLEGGEGSYDPYYEEQRQCTRTERQWDRYANRYVMVDIPVPC